MFPLNFDEFLRKLNPRLFNVYDEIKLENMKKIDDIFHKDFLLYLKLYFIIG